VDKSPGGHKHRPQNAQIGGQKPQKTKAPGPWCLLTAFVFEIKAVAEAVTIKRKMYFACSQLALSFTLLP